MATTLTTVSAILKEDYQPGIREELNNKFRFLRQWEANTEDVVGLEAYLAIHTSRNSGVGFRAEYGTLPTAGNQGYSAEKVKLRYGYGRMAISGPIIKAMATDRGSFDRAMRSETTRLVKDVMRTTNRAAWGTSDGVIADTEANAAATTVNLDVDTTAVQFRQLEPGMLVDIGPKGSNPAGSASQIQILATGGSAGAFTIQFCLPGGSSAIAVTTSDEDSITQSGSGGGASGGPAQKEPTGVQTIVAASGTLFNVDPTVTAVWKSTVSTNSGTKRSISESLIAQQIHAVDIASGEEVRQLWGSDGVYRSVANLLTPIKRFTNTQLLKGGYEALEFAAGGVTCSLAWERDAPSNSLWGFTPEKLIEFYSSDWEFMDNDGAVLSRVPNVDAYEATLEKYLELATDARNAHFLLGDITEN